MLVSKKTAVLLLLALPLAINAQDIDKAKTEIKNSKSGNFMETMYDVIQLATKNITNDEKALEFNSSIYGLRSGFNNALNKDIYIKQHYFQRNFQINLKANFNESNKYDGFSTGFTYAIINDRDKQLIILSNTIYGEQEAVFRKNLVPIQTELSLKIPASNSAEVDLLRTAIEDLILNKDYDSTTNKYYDIVINRYKELYGEDLKESISTLDEIRNGELKKIDAKPLWTISADGTANKNANFSKASLGTVFLKGSEKGWYEIDTRAKLTLDDTLSTPTLPNARLIGSTTTLTRSTFNFKVGVNFKVSRDSANRSLFEIKTYGEYNSILKHKLPDEEKDTFLANADFRIRLANDLWMPITVKYDTKNANLLGFLNVTYNFE